MNPIINKMLYVVKEKMCDNQLLTNIHTYYTKTGTVLPPQIDELERILAPFSVSDILLEKQEKTPTVIYKGIKTYHPIKRLRKPLKFRLDSKIYDKLYGYQRKGIEFIEQRNGRVLLADQMGLGKSCQALCYAELHPELRPLVILVPACLKLNWRKEVKMWTTKNNKTAILDGRTPFEVDADIYIINYDILGKYDKTTKEVTGWVDTLIKKDPKLIIGDEIHFCKNPKSFRTKAFNKLTAYRQHLIFISGTPIMNRPIEIFQIVKRLDYVLFGDWWNFGMRYCQNKIKKNTFGGVDFSGASNTQELNRILTNTFMIRRLKEDVLTELPPKTKIVVPFSINNRKKYTKYEYDFIESLKEECEEKAKKAKNAVALTKMSYLKKIATEGKIDSVIKWITLFLEDEDKLVLFTERTATLDKIQKAFFNECVCLSGATSKEDRQKVVDDFQNKKSIKLFIGQVQAAGVGITLTASNNVAFVETPIVPGIVVQAEDRIHRIGQKKSNVNIYYLIAENTIEVDIISVLDEKSKVLASVLDGAVVAETNLLKEIMIKQSKRIKNNKET